MSMFQASRSNPVEYYLLDHPRAVGEAVGRLGDRPIPELVVDASGRRYRYAGVAPRCPDGTLDVESLRPGEWLVEPGLVYASDGTAGA